MRDTARTARLVLERARFEAWARRLDWALRRAGGRLELDAPHGAHFHALPVLEIEPGTAGVLTLRIGRDVKLGRLLTLHVFAGERSTVELGDRTTFQTACRLILRGGCLSLAEDVFVRDLTQLKVTGGELLMGPRVQVGRDCNLDCSQRIELGRQVGLAERTSVVDSDHAHDGSDVFFMDQPLRSGPIAIGANTFVAANGVVLRGTTVGANAVVGAGAVVRAGELQAGWLHAGVPARPVRPLGG